MNWRNGGLGQEGGSKRDLTVTVKSRTDIKNLECLDTEKHKTLSSIYSFTFSITIYVLGTIIGTQEK